MRSRLSDSTIQLVQSLHAKKSLWERLVHPDPKQEIVRKIADSGEPAAILDLLPILLTANRELALACARAIHHLLAQLKPADFDEYLKKGYYTWPDLQPWHSIKPADISYLAHLGETSVSLLGIASCHRCGYIDPLWVLLSPSKQTT